MQTCLELCTLESHLTAHRVGIYLTHVGTGVVLLDIRHVQFPRVMPVVRDGKSVIVRHHVRVYRQNRSGIRFYPGYLEHRKRILFLEIKVEWKLRLTEYFANRKIRTAAWKSVRSENKINSIYMLAHLLFAYNCDIFSAKCNY